MGDAEALASLPRRRAQAVSVAPARRAAYEVLRRVFEEDAYADRALRTASARSTSATGRSRGSSPTAPSSASATLDHAIETLGKRPVRKLDPPVRAALRLGAYQLGYLDGVPRYAAVNESVELVRARRLERAVPFTNAVLRRARGRDRGAARVAARGAAEALVPGLDLGRLAARSRRGGGARADAGAERAARDRRPARARRDRRRADGHSRRVARRRASTRRRSPRGGSGRRAAARSSPASCVGSQRGRARARPLRGAGREGDDARRRGGRGRGERGPRARARGERPAARRAERPRRPRRRPRAAAELDRLRPRARRRAVLRARRARGAAGPALARASRCPELQLELLLAAAERVRPGGTVVYSVCTINADEAEAVVDASGPRGRADRGVAAVRHPRRPEFLQTLPHVHGTSGFFIARLRVRRLGSRDGLAGLGTRRRDRAVALRGRLREPRRADPGAAATPARASSTSTSATATSSRRSRSGRSSCARSRRSSTTAAAGSTAT